MGIDAGFVLGVNDPDYDPNLPDILKVVGVLESTGIISREERLSLEQKVHLLKLKPDGNIDWNEYYDDDKSSRIVITYHVSTRCNLGPFLDPRDDDNDPIQTLHLYGPGRSFGQSYDDSACDDARFVIMYQDWGRPCISIDDAIDLVKHSDIPALINNLSRTLRRKVQWGMFYY